jgi:hypothetical protein
MGTNNKHLRLVEKLVENSTSENHCKRPRGGIGRHNGLKIRRGKPHAGSTPAGATIVVVAVTYKAPNIVSLATYKETKEFYEGALSRIYPGRYKLSELF